LKALPHIAITLEGYSMVNPITLLEMNSKHPPLDKKEVRQAIAYAVDRKFIIENILVRLRPPRHGPAQCNFAKRAVHERGTAL